MGDDLRVNIKVEGGTFERLLQRKVVIMAKEGRVIVPFDEVIRRLEKAAPRDI